MHSKQKVLVEVGMGRIELFSYCELIEGGMFEIGSNFNTRCGWRWAKIAGIYFSCINMFCVLLYYSIQWDEIFWVHPVILVDKIALLQCIICVMLILFANLSIALKQNCPLKINVIAPLILTLFSPSPMLTNSKCRFPVEYSV